MAAIEPDSEICHDSLAFFQILELKSEALPQKNLLISVLCYHKVSHLQK
jgi:hypothetical protein